MKHISPSLLAAVFGFLVVAPVGLAQTASLTSDSPSLSANGGEITLQASLTYSDNPSALGWAIELPAQWSFARVDGANVPQVQPEVGSTGTIEFAYATVPEFVANFSVTIRYPAGTSPATITAAAILRGGGKLTTLKTAPIEMFRR